MTVTTETAKVVANGNGVATVFSFSPIEIEANDELRVWLVEAGEDPVLLSEGVGASNYSVSSITFPGTGSITYPADTITPLPTGDKVVIKRVLPIKQDLDLTNQGGYYPETQETGFDRLAKMIQQVNETAERALVLPADGSTSVTAGAYTNTDLTVDVRGRITAIANGTPTPGPQGDPGLNWLGAYNGGASYVVDDAVSYSGSSYVCILASTGNLPTNATYWEVLAAKGADGAGSGDMLAANNLSDVANAATARTNLGVAIGSDVQAYDAELAAIAALAVTDGNFVVGNGTTWVAESAGTARASLGLGTLATANTVSNADWSGADLDVANGGTGASTAATARTNLGVAIGSDVQAYDAELAAIAALAVTDGNFMVGNGTTWVAEAGSTARVSMGFTDPVLDRGAPQDINQQTGTTYTTVLADAGKIVECSNAGAIALTIPPNASVAYAVGTQIVVVQTGAGVVTLTPGAGVTLNSRGSLLATAGQYAVAFLYKQATNTWIVTGDVA